MQTKFDAKISLINKQKRTNIDISFHFTIEDKKKAIKCYKFFFSSNDYAINKFPEETFKINYNLKDETKRVVY